MSHKQSRYMDEDNYETVDSIKDDHDHEEGDLSMNRGQIYGSRSISQEFKITMPPANITMPSPLSPTAESPLQLNETDGRSLLSFQKSIAMSAGTAAAQQHLPLWKHPRVRKNPKTIGAAIFLLLFGLAFFGAAIYQFTRHHIQGKGVSKAYIFLFVSALTALPGGYQTVYIYRALKGRPGYHFSGIPSFDV